MKATSLSRLQKNQIARAVIESNFGTLESLLNDIRNSPEDIQFLTDLMSISNSEKLATTPSRTRITLLLALYHALINKDITGLWDLLPDSTDTEFLKNLVGIALSQPASIGRMLAIAVFSIFRPSETVLDEETALSNLCIKAILLGDTLDLKQRLHSASLTPEAVPRDEAKIYLAYLADLLEVASLLKELEKKLEFITILILYGAPSHKLTAQVIDVLCQELSYEQKLYISFMPLATTVNSQIHQQVVAEYKTDYPQFIQQMNKDEKIDLIIPLISFLILNKIHFEKIIEKGTDTYQAFSALIIKRYHAELSSQAEDATDNIAVIKSYVPIENLLDMAFDFHNKLVFKDISSTMLNRLKSTAPCLNAEDFRPESPT